MLRLLSHFHLEGISTDEADGGLDLVSIHRSLVLGCRLTTCTVRFLETIHTAFCIDFFYAYTIQHFGDYRALARINWCASFCPDHTSLPLY